MAEMVMIRRLLSSYCSTPLDFAFENSDLKEDIDLARLEVRVAWKHTLPGDSGAAKANDLLASLSR